MSTPKSIAKHQPVSPAARKTLVRNPLVKSETQAEREKATLRRGRDRLESEPRVVETNIRSSVI